MWREWGGGTREGNGKGGGGGVKIWGKTKVLRGQRDRADDRENRGRSEEWTD